jgi:hypothetical protein
VPLAFLIYFLKYLLRKCKFPIFRLNTNQLQLMNSAEKLYCARCLTIAGLVLVVTLLVLLANSDTSLLSPDMERELASSLEIASSALK